MRSLNTSKRDSAEDSNLIPLINVVFLMLIFFLVAGQVTARDSALFSAPKSSQDNKLEQADVTILLAVDKHVRVNDVLIDKHLVQHLQELGVTPASRVVLKVDANLQAPVLDPILSALQTLGIQRLKLVTVAADS